VSDTPILHNVDLGDGRHLTINISHEGIIMDVWGSHEPGTEPWTNNETGIDHTHLGTAGMMFEEWADWVQTRIDPTLKIGESAL